MTRAFLKLFGAALATAGATGLGLSWAGKHCASCDLASIAYPAWQWALIAGTAAWVVATGRWRSARGWAGMAIAVTVGLFPRGVEVVHPTGDRSTPVLRIVSLNAWERNMSPQFSADWLRAQRPDVIVLIEAKGGAASIPALLASAYPYRMRCSFGPTCSTMILSRRRPAAVRRFARGDTENRRALSALAATFAVADGGTVTVVGLHLSRPLPLGRQRAEIAELTDRLAAFDPTRLVVAGDYNSTRHGEGMRTLAAALALRRVPTGASWPAAGRAWRTPLLAIDSILLGEALRPCSARTGPAVGSDHLPLSVTLCR